MFVLSSYRRPIGNEIIKQEPISISDITEMRPPCARTIFLHWRAPILFLLFVLYRRDQRYEKDVLWESQLHCPILMSTSKPYDPKIYPKQSYPYPPDCLNSIEKNIPKDLSKLMRIQIQTAITDIVL